MRAGPGRTLESKTFKADEYVLYKAHPHDSGRHCVSVTWLFSDGLTCGPQSGLPLVAFQEAPPAQSGPVRENIFLFPHLV